MLPNYHMSAKELLERTAQLMDCFEFLHLLVTFNMPHLFGFECVYFVIPPCSRNTNNLKLNHVVLIDVEFLKLVQYPENRKRLKMFATSLKNTYAITFYVLAC